MVELVLRSASILLCIGLSALAQEQPPAGAPAQLDPVANPESATNYNFVYGSVVPRDRKYVPLTGKQRAWLWVSGNFNTSITIRALLPAAIDQLGHDPSGWQLGAKGYGLRSADRFGRFTIQDGMEIIGSAAMGYETRYIFSKSKSATGRAAHALAMNVVTIDKNGRWVPHIPRIASTIGAEFLCNQWLRKQDRTGAQVGKGMVIQFGISSAYNLVKEFAPEWRRFIKR